VVMMAVPEQVSLQYDYFRMFGWCCWSSLCSGPHVCLFGWDELVSQWSFTQQAWRTPAQLSFCLCWEVVECKIYYEGTMCSLLGTYRIPIPLPRSTMGPELDAVGVRPHHSITFY